MKKNNSNLVLKFKPAQYHQRRDRYNSIVPTMPPIKTQRPNTLKSSDKSYLADDRTSEKKVIFGLGLIAALLLLSVIGLYQSLNVASAQSIENKTNFFKRSIDNTRRLSSTVFIRNNREQDISGIDSAIDRIEILTIQNTVSQGQF